MFIPALLDALHGLVPSARNLFDWTDAEGRLLDYYVEGPIDTEVGRRYFEHFHNGREAACMPAFAMLRDAPAGVRSADDLDREDFFASELYNEIWRPQGFHTRIEGVVRSRTGKLLGSLVLYRGPGEPRFTSHEERTLSALLPWIAKALEPNSASRDEVRSALHVPGPEPTETLLLDLKGRLWLASPGASRLIMLAEGGISPEALTRPVGDRIDRLFGRMISQARERADGPSGTSRPWPSLSIFSAYGRFDAESMLLWAPSGESGSRPPLLQITLRRLEPREVAVQRVLRSLPVTPGQAAVCAALYAGESQGDIARTMGVATSTVVDHVRKLYRALDVSGLPELRDLLDRRLTGATR
ncbi:MAG: hypothetical protein CFE45_00640 [Burkholderiales bacterium PBB5]|nr:MAG: hypothetical protein CFE45_00640 [Burkholderiales bacterium PBB5]